MAMKRTHKSKDETTFLEQVKLYSTPVLDLCGFALASQNKPGFPCRDYLNHLHREATRLQELVDSYGAQTSDTWFPFRESIAAAKLFSGVAYSIKHIQSALDRYELMKIESDCVKKTDAVIGSLKEALISISHNTIDQARRCGILVGEVTPTFKPCDEEVVRYRLPPDRTVRHVAKVGEVVVYLATMFLNMSVDRDVRAVLREPPNSDYTSYVPDPISEERLRIVESRFHNLQSLYDTYIFESDVEHQNSDLQRLRGHISVIYHLTETATSLTHYYVRHMSSLRRDTREAMRYPMTKETLLSMLFEYPLYFSRLYMESAVQLCQKMIKSYSVQTEIDVPIPYYRGFHVRPSTLVATIVAHYGSKVTMMLNGQKYNAGAPLDLFRANEEINAVKRRFIGNMLCQDPALNREISADTAERAREVQLLLVRLMNENKVILYDTDIDLHSLENGEETTLAELATRFIKHLVSLAKMDIRSDITVRFSGDNRALKDLEILANHGYGEDQMGNNIVLPDELSYLSR